MTDKKSSAVVVAHAQKNGAGDGIIVLDNGVRVRINPVASPTILDVTGQIPDPIPPKWHNPDTGEDDPNPNHPDYIKALADVERLRNLASIDAIILWGVDLVDGMPADESWVKKLQFMQKHKQINLSAYDMDDPLDLEFLYKRHVLASAGLMTLIYEKSGLTQEDVDKAVASFPGAEA